MAVLFETSRSDSNLYPTLASVTAKVPVCVYTGFVHVWVLGLSVLYKYDFTGVFVYSIIFECRRISNAGIRPMFIVPPHRTSTFQGLQCLAAIPLASPSL